MAIFDLLTGNASKKAARNNVAAIQQGVTAGADALTRGANSAVDTLGTRGQGTALAALGSGYQQARGDLTAGYAGAAAPLAQLGQAYNPMVQQGGKAYSAYNDAIGANGAAGNARAVANFQSGPGYEYALNQALEAVQRSAASRGMAASGNTSANLLKTATGLADQSWQSYINNLQNGAGFYSTGLTGQSQGLGAQIGASIGQGQQLAQLGQSAGRDQAGVFNTAAGVQSGLGQGVANLWSNATNSLVANNNNLAAAQNAASGSILGGILGGVQSAFGAAGQAGGFSNVFR